MSENIKIARDITKKTILEINYLIELYKKDNLTNEILNKKLSIIKSKYLVNVLFYILSD